MERIALPSGPPPKNVKGSGRYRVFQLYALELRDGCFYVGMTAYKDVQRRFEEHARGGRKGSIWTKEHAPIRVIETRPVGEMFESEVVLLENAMTIEYMNRYGVPKVRGGDMCFRSVAMTTNRYDRHIREMRRQGIVIAETDDE